MIGSVETDHFFVVIGFQNGQKSSKEDGNGNP